MPIVERGYVIIGSPEEVAAQLKEVASNLNVGHLMLLLQFGNMSKDLAKYNTQLFAEKVMPQLHDVFSEWEDRWWPKPMDRSGAGPAFGISPRSYGRRVSAAMPSVLFNARDAGNYERLMGRWSRRLAPLFIAHAGLADGETVLEIGCGTGSLTFELVSAGQARPA